MRKASINIYKFDELKPKIQEKVLNEFRENNDFYFLSTDLKEELLFLLKKNKIKDINNNLELNYSLSYCQGDGLSFTGVFKWKYYKVHITRNNSNYYHENSADIEILTIKDNEISNEKKYNELYKEFKEIYIKICREIEKTGYSIIENEYKEENIKENIEANEYEFTETGDIF